MNILFLDGYTLNPGDLSWAAFQRLGNFTVYNQTCPEEIVPRAQEADVLLINKVHLTRDVLTQLPRLKYIGITATGYDVVDVKSAQRQGIVVCNVPEYSTRSVAQMVFALLLNITNEVQTYSEANKGGVWSQSPCFCYWNTPLMELNGKIMGIYGLGHIGQCVAEIAQAFGMQVIAATSKSQEALPEYIRKVSLDKLFSESDVLSLHCPLSDENRGLVNKERLQTVKKELILINTARGGLVNDMDLAEALTEGRLKAYAADVLSQEPPVENHILLQAPHTYFTPHIAWATKEARERLLLQCARNIEAFIAGSPIHVIHS